MRSRTKHAPFVLVADIGGSHITSAVVDMSTYSILPQTLARRALDSSENAKSILHIWVENLNASHIRCGKNPLPIGIAMPGPFDYENGISLIQGQDKYDALYGIGIKPILASALEIPENQIRMINDAAAFLQGEVFAGGHDGNDKVLGITLGTGLGSAIWTNGKNSEDAALWNTPYQNSIIEESLATRWFVRQAKLRLDVQVRGLKELLELDHPAVDSILDEYSEHLLEFLKLFSERESCKTFIIGGNITRAWPKIKNNFTQAFDRFNIHISRLGEHAALVGAATLF